MSKFFSLWIIYIAACKLPAILLLQLSTLRFCLWARLTVNQCATSAVCCAEQLWQFSCLRGVAAVQCPDSMAASAVSGGDTG